MAGRLAFAFAILFYPCLVLAAAKTQASHETVDIPRDARPAYEGQFKADFENGLSPGAGLGLVQTKSSSPGGLLLYTVTGRGPNAEAPKFLDKYGQKPVTCRFFPAPMFSPSLTQIESGPAGTRLLQLTPIRDETGKPVSGRPIPLGQPGTTGEIAVTDELAMLPRDPMGLSPSCLAVSPAGGGLWIGDDYGPFLLKLNPDTGRIATRLFPGEGLPEILTLRQDNKGISGLAFTPKGALLCSMRAILSIDGAPRESKAAFIRLVEVDPVSGKTRMFAYPIDLSVYRRPFDAQIAGLTQVGGSKYLILEQGREKGGTDRNLVCLIDLDKATDISQLKAPDGGPLEFAASRKALEDLGVKFPKRSVILDLKSVGFKDGQATGLALLDDRQTLAVTRGGESGMYVSLEGPATAEDGGTVKPPGFYTFDGKHKIWYNNTQSSTRFVLKPGGPGLELWRIKLPEPLIP